MKECICCQCSDHEPGYAPTYYQCEGCHWYGTEDEFDDSSDLCIDCHNEINRHTKKEGTNE